MSLPINYVSSCDQDYARGLHATHTLQDLQTHVEIYRRVADDAWRIVSTMSGDDYTEFMAGARRERKGHFVGEAFAEKYGALLLPEVLFQISLLANKFKAPWGCAFIRAKEVGLITEAHGIATYTDPKGES